MATKKDNVDIQVLEVKKGTVEFCVLGETPMLMHKIATKSEKALLAPTGRKTAAEKEGTMKHNPPEEFRESCYLMDSGPTYLAQLGSCFKKAIMGAALDLPGMNKSQMGRLMWVEGEKIGVYGIPRLHMAMVRSADMNRTPDMRTRAILEKWCCRVTVSYIKPLVREQIIANLLAAAGFTQGIGDYRPQKGAGAFGQFKLVDADDPEFKMLEKTAGRLPQTKALENIEFYDDYARELVAHWESEKERRGFDEKPTRKTRKTNGKGVANETRPN